MLRPGSLPFLLLLAALSSAPSLAIDMNLPALPRLGQVFAADAGEVQLTLSVFFIGFALAQPVLGPLSDRYGRRPILLAGLMLFTVGGIGSALADSLGLLIAFRFVQAIGACAGPLVARAMVRDLFAREEAARMLSIMATAFAAAPILGPLIGGQIMALWDWQAIFVVLGLVGIILLAISWKGLAESLPRPGPDALRPRRLLADARALLSDRAYLGYTLTIGLALSGMFAYISGSPFVFITVYGVSSEAFGLYFGAASIAFMVSAFVNGRLVPRFGLDRMLGFGVAACAAAGLALALVAITGVGGPMALMAPIVVYLATIGLILPNAMAAALHPFPEKAGTASALIGTLQMSLAAAAGYLVNFLFDGSALPMALVLASMAVGAFIVFRLMAPR